MYGPNSSHPSIQFLNNVLSQRGPSALPYNEDVKWYIRQHLVALVQDYPSLQVKTAVFAHNDGRTANLLQAEGTIPMHYQHVTYNIPVVIWLMDSYPRQHPWVFLNPTRDMIIRRGHPLVNPSGMVSVPYLHGWVFPSSNLVELVKNMGHLFGRDPPLYTKQPSAAPGHRIHSPTRGSSSSAAAGPSPSPSPSPPPPPSSSSSSSSVWNHQAGGGRPSAGAIPNRLLSPYGRTMPLPPSPQRPPAATEDPSEVFKRNAINKLLELMHSDTVALRKAREAEMDSLFNLQGALRKREERLDKGLKEMMDEKEALEQLLQMILMNSDVLEAWVRENCNKKSEIDIDVVFEPADPLSRQMLECASADFSIEDAIYSLDKAVQKGLIPFGAYMRNIRALSREQFFHRATSAKVKAASLQAQVTSMASRASLYDS